MLGFKRVMRRPLRQLFHPNALLMSPAVMYSGGGGHRKELLPRLTCESSAKGGICNVYLVGAVNYVPKYLEELSREGKKASPVRLLVAEETLESLKEISREHEKACQEIRAVISSLKPEVVFLGLDPSLSHDLKPHQMLRRILGSLFDDEVTIEYRVAYEEAQKYGANVILGDRPREITCGRANATSIVVKSFLFLAPNMMMNHVDFGINNGCDTLCGVEKTKVNKIFVDERNRYMSATLLKVAREHNSVVAVVGRWHLPGIKKYWKQPIEVEELLSVT